MSQAGQFTLSSDTRQRLHHPAPPMRAGHLFVFPRRLSDAHDIADCWLQTGEVDSYMPRLSTPCDGMLGVFHLRQLRCETQAEFVYFLQRAVSTASKWDQGRTEPSPRQGRKLEGLAAQAGFPPPLWPDDAQQPLFSVSSSA